MLFRFVLLISLGWALCAPLPAPAKDKNKAPAVSSFDAFLEQARLEAARTAPSSGSTWSPSAQLVDVSADLRARRLHDTLTIIVRETASAVSQGSVASSRNSQADSSIGALAGIPSPAGGLQNLLGLKSDKKMQGEGETSRRTVLTTTMSARVTEVLPNGNLVISGERVVAIDSESQTIVLRGIVRPYDISVSNAVASEQIAQLELRIAGKGVVGDAVKRPGFLYRILLGWLPF